MWTLSLTLLACQEEPEVSVPDYGADVVGLMRTWCTACHGEVQAQGGVRLDSLEAVRAAGQGALSQMQAGVMPPGGGLREAEIQAFALWLEAGSPGEELQGVGEWQGPPPGELALETNVFVWEQGVQFVMLSEVATSAERISMELWQLVDGRVGLLERTLYQDGQELSVDTWDPALVVYDADLSAWTQDTQHTRQDALGTESWPEQWTAQAWDDGDPRSIALEVQGNLVQEAGGARVGLQVGDAVWVARVHDEPLDALPYRGHLSARVEVPPRALLEHGSVWSERVIGWAQ